MTAVYVLLGLLAVAVIVLQILILRRRPDRDLTRQLADELQAQKLQDLDRVIAQLKDAFGALSRDALTQNTEQFLHLARTRLEQQTRSGEQALDEKKKLIDTALTQMTTKLAEIHATVQRADSERKASHERLTDRLSEAAKVTDQLRATTAQLREALASSRRRGQWGERMAEDVLRLAGFQEGFNYTKQTTLDSGQRPDYTFFLPRDLRVNMDVKFPLDNYLKFLDAPDPDRAAAARELFLRDVRACIKSVCTREYVDPAAGTVDYVLLFVPNEQVYAFIHECDNRMIDDALSRKVVLCSPLTLYAILAVIRQSVETARLQRASDEILALLGEFQKQWQRYGEVVDRLGQRLEAAMKEYQNLTTTRTRQLERQLDKLDDLRQQRGLALPQETGTGADEPDATG